MASQQANLPVHPQGLQIADGLGQGDAAEVHRQAGGFGKRPGQGDRQAARSGAEISPKGRLRAWRQPILGLLQRIGFKPSWAAGLEQKLHHELGLLAGDQHTGADDHGP